MIVEIFKKTDIHKLLNTGKDNKIDPFLHFYETFLNSYDKINKKKRGVYYTPPEVVKFIVNATDNILKNNILTLLQKK